MPSRHPFLIGLIGLCVVCGPGAALAACSAFSGEEGDGNTPATPDAGVEAAAEDALGDDAARPDDGGDGGADASATSCDATFCDDFEHGDLEVATAKWGFLEDSAGGALDVFREGNGNYFLHAAIGAGTNSYARLTRRLGSVSPTTVISLEFRARTTTPGAYEVLVFNMANGSDDIVADIAIRNTASGGFIVRSDDGVTQAATNETANASDGQWHRFRLSADVMGTKLQMDNQTPVMVAGTSLATYPRWFLSAGAFSFGNASALAVDIDDVVLRIY